MESGRKDWLIVEYVRDMAGLGSRVLESVIHLAVDIQGLWALFCTHFGPKGLK